MATLRRANQTNLLTNCTTEFKANLGPGMAVRSP